VSNYLTHQGEGSLLCSAVASHSAHLARTRCVGNRSAIKRASGQHLKENGERMWQMTSSRGNKEEE